MSTLISLLATFSSMGPIRDCGKVSCIHHLSPPVQHTANSSREVGIFGNPLTNGGFPDGNHFAQVVPLYARDMWTENITCGRAAFDFMEKTEIADVVAGEEVGFRTMLDEELNAGGSYGYFYHPGATQVWLSRASEDDLKAYRGDGDWFKFAYTGPKNDREWFLWNQESPKQTDVRSTPKC